MALYTVLMYNFNNYEILREPEELDSEAEYIYVTDNKDLHSDKWKIVVDDSLNGLSPFDKCYRVRFNLFKYASSPVCIYVDGSIQIHKSLRPLYDAFIQSESDIGLNVHPTRCTLRDEYETWVKLRNYSRYQQLKCYAMFDAAQYDLSYKGLYQGTCRIVKNTYINQHIDNTTLQFLLKLGSNNIIERLDQTIYSFVVNKFFQSITVFPFSQQVFQNNYMTWMHHNTKSPIPMCHDQYMNTGYVFNKLTQLFTLK